MKRIMVDMSATLIHHGHIRLINKAKEYGKVIVGLTTDNEILSYKGYQPEISFKHRKEIIEAIGAVSEVVAVPWLITNDTLVEHHIDLLVHGYDNSNPIDKDKLLIFDRTAGISSSDIRYNALRAITQTNNQKLMLTPGPASLLYENIKYLTPLFGRGDNDFDQIYNGVEHWVKEISGQDQLIISQGSATFSLELAAHTFVSGDVLLISTGYYSDRIETLLPKTCQVTTVDYSEYFNVSGQYDWVCCAYTETSTAFKLDLPKVKEKANTLNAKLYVDSTGSIGLEDHHDMCDVTAFSSCKGLFGLTGASFIAHKNNLTPLQTDHFYFNYHTHKEHKVTGAYHALASLYGVMPEHNQLRNNVEKSKQYTLDKYSKFILTKENQPLLCTHLNGTVKKKDDNIVLYSPRSNLKGSIICHFGEIHKESVALDKRIEVIGL